MEKIFYDLVEQYGIYAVFVLCMVEGDITLLLAGVLAHNRSFGQYSFGQVVFFGTTGALLGDFIGYAIGRKFRDSVSNFHFYKMSQPRIERMTEKFGPLSVFISKYIYGIRAAWCIFFGISGMPWWRFLLLDAGSCLLWVLMLSGIGYFFSGAVTNLIGDIHKYGIVLVAIVAAGIIGFYLLERFWLSKKVEQKAEQVEPEKAHPLEEPLHVTLHDLAGEIQDRLNSGGGSNNSPNGNGASPPDETVIQPTKSQEPRKAESE